MKLMKAKVRRAKAIIKSKIVKNIIKFHYKDKNWQNMRTLESVQAVAKKMII